MTWGGIAWRVIAIGVVIYFGFRALTTISVVILAVVVAMFLAAVLWKPSYWLRDRGLPPALASLLTLIGAVAVIAGVITLIVPQVADNVEPLTEDVGELADTGRNWLINGPLGLTEAEIDNYWESFTEWAQSPGGASLLGGATAVLEGVTGTILAIIVTFFMLKDGRQLMDGFERRLSDDKAGKVETGFKVGRRALAQYMGGMAVVGLFDAFFIALALWIVGAPLVLPLAVIVFFGAFIPLVGAFVSGLLAVAVAFVNGGVTDGLIILAVVIGIQQFEGDVIMPLVFGQTLRLHPLVILLGVTAGGLAFGLFGAFLAIPLIAVAVAIHEALADEPES
ncbi:MAG TPA: AI-2E family transporter, partial [Acidimicrobiia bacterium]|nr:AI-2E family transporter [Acidimicrobiia bacterium]